MPTVLRIGPYRFFFFADERQEPPHIHVVAAEKQAKYWIQPPGLAWSDGFRTGELKEIESILLANIELILGAWHEFFLGR